MEKSTQLGLEFRKKVLVTASLAIAIAFVRIKSIRIQLTPEVVCSVRIAINYCILCFNMIIDSTDIAYSAYNQKKVL